MTLAKSILVWLFLAILMIINGIARQELYAGPAGDLAAHHISTLTGAALSFLLVWAVTARWPFRSARQAAATGILWLLMTVAFEFLFGHFIAGHPWQRLLRDYDLSAGRVWSLYLLWITVTPLILHRMRR
jgi:hypothetical protein